MKTMTPTIPDVVQKTHEILKSVRKNVVLLMQNLYFLRENYQGEEPFGQYAEEEFGLSQSYVSKLCSVAEHYLIKGGVSADAITGCDYESLYLAAKTGGTVDEQLARATTLTRSELKQTNAEEKPHVGDFGEFCKVCWLSKTSHP